MRRDGREKKEGKVAMDDEPRPAMMRRVWMDACARPRETRTTRGAAGVVVSRRGI